MNFKNRTYPFALAFAARTSARSFLRFGLIRSNFSIALFPRPSIRSRLNQEQRVESASLATDPASIYAVDDLPRLTDLYTGLLAATGYRLRTFNDRVKALAALKVDKMKPALLITDYLGFSMPINQFIQACCYIHPDLRILMVSGFCETEMRFSRVRPNVFLQKPFAPDEFQTAVRTALAGGNSSASHHRWNDC